MVVLSSAARRDGHKAEFEYWAAERGMLLLVLLGLVPRSLRLVVSSIIRRVGDTTYARKKNKAARVVSQRRPSGLNGDSAWEIDVGAAASRALAIESKSSSLLLLLASPPSQGSAYGRRLRSVNDVKCCSFKDA